MTADQARQLADSFDSIATSTSSYISNNRQKLSSDQIYDLVRMIGDLHVAAANLETDAVDFELADAQTSVTALKKLIVAGKSAIKDIDEIGKVLTLITSVVTLAGAIAAKDPNGALNGIVAVGSAIKDLQDAQTPA